MQTETDICIIGGGILGCMMARELGRYPVRTMLLEKKKDICTGITKANSAILYAGYDHKPHTLKSRMCLNGNNGIIELCEKLNVPIKRPGSIMFGFEETAEHVLKRKYEQGLENGVPGLRLLGRDEILALEPGLNPEVSLGLFAPTTGTVNPWELGIAAYENALVNGVSSFMQSEVTAIRYRHSFYELEVLDKAKGKIHFINAKGVINCAGIYADKVSEMLLSPRIRIRPTKAAYLLFSPQLKQMPKHILFYEPAKQEKGLTLVPTVDGKLLAGASEETASSLEDHATNSWGLDELKRKVSFVFPNLDTDRLLCNFAGVRPNPVDLLNGGKNVHGFAIRQEKEYPGFISLIGVKTPGLTCSLELAKYTIQKLFQGIGFNLKERKDFKEGTVSRKKEPSGRIICHCNQITEGQIREAFHRGATTVEGVKHRCCVTMGHCQGTRCRRLIEKILQEEQVSHV